MADLSDVERALVAQIAVALFGVVDYQPGAAAPSAACGAKVRVFRGWPAAAGLDADIAAGVANVSVFPESGMGRNVTRYEDEWTIASPCTPTLTVEAAGAVVTFGGTAGAGHVAGVQAGHGVSPAAYAYRVTATDTLATVAAALAAMIPGAVASGPALTLASADGVWAAVARDQAAWLETRRQMQVIKISFWCPSPAARDAVAGAADNALARMRWLPLADGSDGRLIYQGTHVFDATGRAAIWRRDLRYQVEWATTYIEQQPQALFAPMHCTAGNGGGFIIGPEAPGRSI